MKTKKKGIVDQLKKKYRNELARAQRELKAGKKAAPDRGYSDWIMFSKWAYRVAKGWYGFCLGNVPRVWTDVLDEFLQWLEAQRPDFEIHQVKMKFGRLCFYVGTKSHLMIPDENIRSEISKLEKLLTRPQLKETLIRMARQKRQKQIRAK